MSDELYTNVNNNDADSLVESEQINEDASENYIDAIIEENNLHVSLLLNSLEVALPGSLGSEVLLTLNGTQTTTPVWYAPIGSGTTGQILYSNGSGNAPTWGSLPTITYTSSINTGTLIGTLNINGVSHRLYYTQSSGGSSYTAGAHITISTANTISVNTTSLSSWISGLGYATQSWVTSKGYLTASSTLDATKVSGTLPTSTYTNTTYTAGTALGISGTTFYVKLGTSSTQAAAGNHTHSNYLTASSTLDATKVSGTLPTGTYTNTTYTAGTALGISGTTFYVKLGTSSTQAAAGNHIHSDYLTREEASSTLSTYATETWVTGLGYITSAALTNYATQSWVENKHYVNMETLGTTLSRYSGSGITITSTTYGGWVELGISINYDVVASKTWCNNTFLTAHQSLSAYLTREEASSTLSTYATKSWVSSNYATSGHTHSQYTDWENLARNLIAFKQNGITIATGSNWSEIKIGVSFGTASTQAAAGNHTHSNYLTASSTLDATKVSGTLPSSTYTNTTYSTFNTTTNGLVPYSGSNTSKFLRGDGTWQTAITAHQSLSGYLQVPGSSGYSDGYYILQRTGSAIGNPTHTWQLLSSSIITSALGYTPLQSSDLSGYATQSWVTGLGYQDATDVSNTVDEALENYDQYVSGTYSTIGHTHSTYSTTGHTHSTYAPKASPSFTGTVTITTSTTANALKLKRLLIPTSSGGSTYGAGTSGQVLKTNGTTVYWGTDEKSSVCLLEGTMISMADGTKKEIQNVSVGDEILSYDPNTGTTCSAVVFLNQYTGEDTGNLNEALFIDEDTNETYSLLIYKDHGVYKTYSDDDPLSEGHGTGIKSWRCSTLSKDKALSSKLHNITFVGIDEFEYTTKVKHYNLLTSNIYYFADDVLCAGSQWQQIEDLMNNYMPTLEGTELLNKFIQLNTEIENIRPKFKSQKIENSERDGLRLKKENESKFIRRMMLVRTIEGYKKQLSDLDYMNDKYNEGAITKEEWEKVVAQKSEIRSKIEIIKEEIRNGDINKHNTVEHVQLLKACKDEIKLLLDNRNLFDELINKLREEN